MPSTSPTGTPICGQLPIRPRRFWSPHSIDSSTEPLHSPPTAMPCSTRSSDQQQRRGDADRGGPGQDADEGVADPITSSVMISVALRPIRSPQWPKIAAPIGRAANPTK